MVHSQDRLSSAFTAIRCNDSLCISRFYRSAYIRGVNLYVFHVSLTDFHCFDWLTYVRGNPYGFIIKKKKKKLIFFN